VLVARKVEECLYSVMGVGGGLVPRTVTVVSLMVMYALQKPVAATLWASNARSTLS